MMAKLAMRMIFMTKKLKICKLIGVVLYWGACLAAGCLYGFGAAVLVVAGAVFAALVISAEGEDE